LKAHQDLEDFVADLIPERRARPTYLYDTAGKNMGEDIITRLARTEVDGDLLSPEEVTSNIVLIVAAGGETTRGLIMNVWYALLTHVEQFRAVERDPELFEQAVHETLRYCSSIGGQPRHTSYDMTIHDVHVPAGSLVHCVDFSGNHDERVFKDPETFDIFRDDLYTGKIIRNGYHANGRHSHLAFGVGPHLCPGAWIAAQEAILGSQVLIQHIRNPAINHERQAKDPVEPDKLAPLSQGAIRELWIDFDPA
jgi:cytochrome P450